MSFFKEAPAAALNPKADWFLEVLERHHLQLHLQRRGSALVVLLSEWSLGLTMFFFKSTWKRVQLVLLVSEPSTFLQSFHVVSSS